MKKMYLYYVIIVAAFLLLPSCYSNQYYGKVHESLYFINQTDSLVFIRFGFEGRKSPFQTVLLDTNQSYEYDFNESYIENLWMSENEFDGYVSQISIYSLIDNDTLYVDSSFYNHKVLWKYQYIDGNINSFYWENSPRVVDSLYITNQMFK